MEGRILNDNRSGMYGYKLKIKWLGVASFELKKDGHHIITDPFITLNDNSPCTWENVDGCELITITHVHWDHITDIPVLMRKYGNPPLLTGTLSALPLCTWGNLCPQSVYPMDSNLELDFDWVKVKALFGRHVTNNLTVNEQEPQLRRKPFVDRAMGDMQVLGSLEYRNFLFTFPDGVKLLVWGNDFLPIQKNIVKELKPDIALLQATKQLKDPEGYVDFVKASEAKVVIPHHMDLAKPYDECKSELMAMKEKIETACPGTEFIMPDYGKWIEL